MTDPTPYIARLGLARDQFAEARRYVRTRPEETKRLIHDALKELDDDPPASDDPPSLSVDRARRERHDRLGDILIIVMRLMAVDPDAARGGIDLVRHELACVMSELRREWEREARDRELMEAYGS